MDLNMNIKDAVKLTSRQKKPGRFLTKRGINLAENPDARSRTTTLAVTGVVVLVVLLVVLKFGVIDQLARRDAAEARYLAAQAQNDTIAAALADYDTVLLEYRTYSMDWMNNDTSGKYVTVDRQDILDLIEHKMMTKGLVTDIDIKGSTVEVQMQGMDLKQISEMCGQLEGVDFVKSATLETASTLRYSNAPETEGTDQSDSLLFLIRIELQPKTAKEG